MTHSLSVTNWQMSCRNREEPTGESVSSTMTDICCMWTNWPVGGHPMYKDAGNVWVNLDEQACVSMNMWGFTPRVFDALDRGFDRFVRQHGMDTKQAYILPEFVNEWIDEGARVRHLPTAARWMALVSPDDKSQTLLRMNEMIRKGVYPLRLFAEEQHEM